MGRLVARSLATGFLAVLSILMLLFAQPVAAQSDAEVVDFLDSTGRYLEIEDSSIDVAADRANSEGIAFIWLDQPGDVAAAQNLAEDYVTGLADRGSRYGTVLVLTSDSYAAFSTSYGEASIESALDASFDSFSAGAIARGLDTFTSSLAGTLPDSQAESTNQGAGETADSGAGDSANESSGPGFGTVLLVIAVLGGGFLMFRSWSGKRRRRRAEAIELEEDRVEIEEQLKNNADRVMNLGDRVIATGNPTLIATYEEASRSYQDVSLRINDATTAPEIDELDDRIDHAEWQFESIEAQLDGRPAPPSPAEVEAAEAAADTPPPPSPPSPADRRQADDRARSQQADDRYIATSPRTGRSYPRTSGGTGTRRGGGIGGALGGAMSGGLGGILGKIILGGGLGGLTQSRRSRRRTGGSSGFPGLGGTNRRSGGDRRGGGLSPNLGGGVLRRGGSTAPRRTGGAGSGRSRSKTRSRSRSRSSRKGSGGGRKL